MTFGEELTARRQQLRLSQASAARKAGVARGTWRAWEKDESEPQDYNYASIEQAMEWEAGSVQLLILKRGKPAVASRRIDVDPLRDETEHAMWVYVDVMGEERIWRDIDTRRDRLAREAKEAERRARRHDSA